MAQVIKNKQTFTNSNEGKGLASNINSRQQSRGMYFPK